MSFRMLLITIFQSALASDYSGIYTYANGGSASDLKYNLIMQKKAPMGTNVHSFYT